MLATCVASCSDRALHDPVEIFSANIPIDGGSPATVTRPLQRGLYLVEVREIDIDARVSIESPGSRAALENAVPRHGVVYEVVSLQAAGDLRVELSSADHHSRKGSVRLRIARWARGLDERPGERELGFEAESSAAEIAANATPESWVRAADKMHEAITHFQTIHDDLSRADAAYTLAYIQYGPRDEYAASVRACETAAEAFKEAQDDVGAENAFTLQGAVEIEMAASMKADTQRAEQAALYASADRRLAHAAEFFAQRNLPIRAQYAVNMRAVRAVNVGDYDTAASLFSRAAGMARANSDIQEEARSLANSAAVDIYRGYMSQAAQEYEALLPLLDKKAQPYQYAVTLGNFGVALISLGDFDRALTVQLQALDIYKQLGNQYESAIELTALGGLYFRMGDPERALETLRSAIAAQERLSDAKNLSETLRVAGNVASELSQHDLALDYLRRSARLDGAAVSVARTRVLIAGELRMTGDLTRAEAELAEPLNSPNSLVLASATDEHGRIRKARGELSAAIDDFRSADRQFKDLGLEINRIDAITALSGALLETHDVAGAAAAADDAIAIVGHVRVKSANPEWRARFLSARYAPFEARIAADIASADPSASWRAFLVAEEVRGRSMADEAHVRDSGAMRQSDPEEDALRARLTTQQLRLESRIQGTATDEIVTQQLRTSIEETRAQLDRLRAKHGAAASNRYALSRDLARVQRALPADTAVLAYFLGDSGSHAWLLTSAKLEHFALPKRVEVQRAITAAQREIRSGKIGAATRDLGETLLRPSLGGAPQKHLLILADGALNSAPFAALPVPGAGGALIVDRFVLGSASSLAMAMSSPARSRSANMRVAVVSDPVYAADDNRLRLAMDGAGKNLRGPPGQSPNNLTRLPYSALEASAVARAFGANDSINLSGFDATMARVLALPSRDLAVLHFATHAVARSAYPEQSALFLTEYAPDGTMLPSSRLTVADIAHSGLRADVVVLSGCATGDGSALRGEGVLGLTYGFLANGSRSVVASLWPIEDAATARFMNEFYRAYRTNGRAADALRTAQLTARSNTPPNVWTSFVVRANEFP